MAVTSFWKSRAPTSAATVALVCLVAASVAFFALRPEAAVTAANFDLTAARLPANAAAIELTLNRAPDASALSADSFKIEPFLEGALSVRGKVVAYSLRQPLVAGETYRVTLSKRIVGQPGEWSYQFLATDAAAVTAVFPRGELSDLSQPVTVVFSAPMVPTAALEATDKIPCPVTLKPSVPGKCRWVSGNVLEFLADKGFDGATRYAVAVAPTQGLKYSFAATGATFFTPALELSFSNVYSAEATPAPGISTGTWFRPDEGVMVRSNFPLDVASLAKSATVDGAAVSAVALSGSSRDYVITPATGAFRFGGAYRVAVASGVAPKFGNVAWSGSLKADLKASGIVESVEAFRDIKSSTGALLDSVATDGALPLSNAWLRVALAREVPLSSVRLETADGKAVLTRASYVKEERYRSTRYQSEHPEAFDGTGPQPDMTIVENRARVRLDVDAKLAYGQKLAVVVDASASPSLSASARTPVAAAAEPGVFFFTPKSATKACVAFKTPMDAYAVQAALVAAPAARVSSVIPAEWDGFAGDADRCPDNTLAINWRLKPKTQYAFSFSGLTDLAGSPMPAWKGTYRTPDALSDKDRYLYLSWAREDNTFPQGVPLVVNLQAMNAASVTVQACETDFSGYRDFLQNRWSPNWAPKCSASIEKEIPTRLTWWSLTNNRVDLEKDVLGRAQVTPYLIVRGSVAGWNLGENGYRDGQREFAAVIVRSGLSVTLESGGNRQLLFVTDFSGKPVAGNPEIQLYTQSWAVNAPAVSQLSHKDAGFRKGTADGVWEMSGEPRPAYVEVRSQGKFALLDTSVHMASNYEFKYVSGQDASAKDYLFLYPDRPIYRPGDTVSFKGLLRRFNPDGYVLSPSVSGRLRVTSSDGSETWSGPVKLDKNSNFSGQFVLPAGSPLGNFAFGFTPDGGGWVLSNGTFSVERYAKPTFKLNAAAASAEIALGQKSVVTVAPEYYFGGKLTGVAGHWQTLSQDYFFDAKDYSDWQFGEGSRYRDCVYWDSCSYGDSVVAAGDLMVGADGAARLEATYTSTGQAEKIYSTTVTVADPATGRSVSQTVPQAVHATDAYVGLRVPYWNPRGAAVAADLVSLDWDAKPKSVSDVTVTLTRRTWNETRKQGVDGAFYSEWALESAVESSQKASTDARGLASLKLSPKSTGDYEIRVRYVGANGMPFESAANVWVEGDADASFRQSDNSVTDLVADAGHAKVGDTVGFTLMTPAGTGTALFTVEKDDGILSYFTKAVTGPSTRVTLPITAAYLPNVYLKAFTVGTASGADLPSYKRGLAVVKVDTADRKLTVNVSTDKARYLPGDKVAAKITVTDAAGKLVAGANGSLAVVDESVLALKGNPAKNPYAFFYDMKRYLGVETFASLMNLVEKLEVKDTSDGQKGGAGDQLKGGASKTKRGVFKDTATWVADFTTGPDGSATLTTEALPDNLTTWNLEAVVDVPAGNFVGVGSASVTTQQSAMITENLPRVLAAGDELVLAPAVANRSGAQETFTVSIKADGIEVMDAQKTVTVPHGGNLPVVFRVKVPAGSPTESARQAKISFEAVGDRGDRDAVERFVPIVQDLAPETVATVGTSTGAGTMESVSVPQGVPASVSVRWSATPIALAPAGLDDADSYAEASAWWTPGVVAALATKDLYDALAVPYDLTKKTVKVWGGPQLGYVDTPLATVLGNWAVNVRDHQMTSGGFSWTPSAYPYGRVEDAGLTSDVLQALAALKRLKFSVDAPSLDDAVRWAKGTFYANKRPGCFVTKWDDCKLSVADRRALLRGFLAASGDASESAKMLQLLPTDKVPGGDELETLALVASAGLPDAQGKPLAGKLETGLTAALSNNLAYNPRGAFIKLEEDRFGQTARFVRAAALGGKAQDPAFAAALANAVRWLAGQRANLSPADSAAFAQAAAAFAKATGAAAAGFTTELKWNGEALATQKVDASNKLGSWSLVLSGAQLAAENSFVAQVSGGKGSAWYALALSYAVPASAAQARDEGFTVTRAFYDYAAYKAVLALQAQETKDVESGKISWDDRTYAKDAFEYVGPVTEGKIGQLLVARVRMIVPETRDAVRFDGYVPAGAELVNPNLATEAPDASVRGSTSGLGEASGQSSEPSAWSCVWCGGLWDRDEYRDDRYVGFAQRVEAGVHQFGYVLRLTHAGSFSVKPAQAQETATPEMFGRSAGASFTVK